MDNTPIKIMISSSVYGFEDQLVQIGSELRTYGYYVISSYLGTVRTDSRFSNLELSVKAVEDCDVFLGIIRTNMGTGNIDDKNITLEEMRTAIRLNKPRWFLTDDRVPFARILKNHLDPKDAKFKKCNVFDPLSIDAYSEVTGDGIPLAERKGNWVQPYHTISDILRFVNSQFSNIEAVKTIIKEARQ